MCRSLGLEPLWASFGSIQWIETATVSLDDERQPVPGYSVVMVCQCSRHSVLPAFVCRSQSFVNATYLECAYGTMSWARRLHGSLSKRNSFQLHETKNMKKFDNSLMFSLFFLSPNGGNNDNNDNSNNNGIERCTRMSDCRCFSNVICMCFCVEKFFVRFNRDPIFFFALREWIRFGTYTMRRSQLAQIFWPGGSPPVDGGAGRSIGALTCFVAGAL